MKILYCLSWAIAVVVAWLFVVCLLYGMGYWPGLTPEAEMGLWRTSAIVATVFFVGCGAVTFIGYYQTRTMRQRTTARKDQQDLYRILGLTDRGTVEDAIEILERRRRSNDVLKEGIVPR